MIEQEVASNSWDAFAAPNGAALRVVALRIAVRLAAPPTE